MAFKISDLQSTALRKIATEVDQQSNKNNVIEGKELIVFAHMVSKQEKTLKADFDEAYLFLLQQAKDSYSKAYPKKEDNRTFLQKVKDYIYKTLFDPGNGNPRVIIPTEEMEAFDILDWTPRSK